MMQLLMKYWLKWPVAYQLVKLSITFFRYKTGRGDAAEKEHKRVDQRKYNGRGG